MPTEHRLGERPGHIEVDHVVRQLDEWDVERFRERPAELLLGEHTHREQHLTEPAPAHPLPGQRLVELLSRHQLALEEHVAQPLSLAHARDLRTISWASSPSRSGENGLVTWADAPIPSLSCL